jgi:hypothetical protein
MHIDELKTLVKLTVDHFFTSIIPVERSGIRQIRFEFQTNIPRVIVNMRVNLWLIQEEKKCTRFCHLNVTRRLSHTYQKNGNRCYIDTGDMFVVSEI